MKELTPKTVVVRIAMLVAVVATIVATTLQAFFSGNIFLLIISVFLTTFGLAYLAFYLAMEKFIAKKIKDIYRTIHNLKLKEGVVKEIKLDSDIFSQVNKEVQDWDKANKKEIERLRGLESYRREFVGNVSHELKTPIFNIQGYLLTLLEGGCQTPQ